MKLTISIGVDMCWIFYNTIGKNKFYIETGYYYIYDIYIYIYIYIYIFVCVYSVLMYMMACMQTCMHNFGVYVVFIDIKY